MGHKNEDPNVSKKAYAVASVASTLTEQVIFHPLDSWIKNLMRSGEGKATFSNEMKVLKNSNVFSAVARAYQGIGFSTLKKLPLRGYKWIFSRRLNESIEKNHGAKLQKIFGDKGGQVAAAAIAGGITGALEPLVPGVYPLDIMQIQRQMEKKQGQVKPATSHAELPRLTFWQQWNLKVVARYKAWQERLSSFTLRDISRASLFTGLARNKPGMASMIATEKALSVNFNQEDNKVKGAVFSMFASWVSALASQLGDVYRVRTLEKAMVVRQAEIDLAKVRANVDVNLIRETKLPRALPFYQAALYNAHYADLKGTLPRPTVREIIAITPLKEAAFSGLKERLLGGTKVGVGFAAFNLYLNIAKSWFPKKEGSTPKSRLVA